MEKDTSLKDIYKMLQAEEIGRTYEQTTKKAAELLELVDEESAKDWNNKAAQNAEHPRPAEAPAAHQLNKCKNNCRGTEYKRDDAHGNTSATFYMVYDAGRWEMFPAGSLQKPPLRVKSAKSSRQRSFAQT